ncbi:hypothetical protein HDU85_005203 [Gaertneriomyces sp. JEL0708]|nr:hypothetical protein HDU85_005203 [Gaertneriomyces sp. JEL0708]
MKPVTAMSQGTHSRDSSTESLISASSHLSAAAAACGFPADSKVADVIYACVMNDDLDNLHKYLELLSRSTDVLQALLTYQIGDQQHEWDEDIKGDAEELLGLSLEHMNLLHLACIMNEEDMALEILNFVSAVTDEIEARKILYEFMGRIWGNGNTVLHLASFMGMSELVERLLQLGATKRKKNERGYRPVDCADDDVTRDKFNTVEALATHDNSERGSTEMIGGSHETLLPTEVAPVVEVVSSHSTSSDEVSDGVSATSQTVPCVNEEAIARLSNTSTQLSPVTPSTLPNQSSQKKRKAVKFDPITGILDICRWGSLHSPDYMDTLTQMLSSCETVVDFLTPQKSMTPLHLACTYGHVDIVHLLLSYTDSLVNSYDDEGWTPLHCACAEGHVEVVKLLGKCQGTGRGGTVPDRDVTEGVGKLESPNDVLCYYPPDGPIYWTPLNSDGETPQQIILENVKDELEKILTELAIRYPQSSAQDDTAEHFAADHDSDEETSESDEEDDNETPKASQQIAPPKVSAADTSVNVSDALPTAVKTTEKVERPATPAVGIFPTAPERPLMPVAPAALKHDGGTIYYHDLTPIIERKGDALVDEDAEPTSRSPGMANKDAMVATVSPDMEKHGVASAIAEGRSTLAQTHPSDLPVKGLVSSTLNEQYAGDLPNKDIIAATRTRQPIMSGIVATSISRPPPQPIDIADKGVLTLPPKDAAPTTKHVATIGESDNLPSSPRRRMPVLIGSHIEAAFPKDQDATKTPSTDVKPTILQTNPPTGITDTTISKHIIEETTPATSRQPPFAANTHRLHDESSQIHSMQNVLQNSPPSPPSSTVRDDTREITNTDVGRPSLQKQPSEASIHKDITFATSRIQSPTAKVPAEIAETLAQSRSETFNSAIPVSTNTMTVVAKPSASRRSFVASAARVSASTRTPLSLPISRASPTSPYSPCPPSPVSPGGNISPRRKFPIVRRSSVSSSESIGTPFVPIGTSNDNTVLAPLPESPNKASGSKLVARTGTVSQTSPRKHARARPLSASFEAVSVRNSITGFEEAAAKTNVAHLPSSATNSPPTAKSKAVCPDGVYGRTFEFGTSRGSAAAALQPMCTYSDSELTWDNQQSSSSRRISESSTSTESTCATSRPGGFSRYLPLMTSSSSSTKSRQKEEGPKREKIKKIRESAQRKESHIEMDKHVANILGIGK